MEFQVDHGTATEATDFMASATFAANPVGVVYDPDALLALYEAGASEAQLMKFPQGQPSPIPTEHGFA